MKKIFENIVRPFFLFMLLINSTSLHAAIDGLYYSFHGYFATVTGGDPTFLENNRDLVIPETVTYNDTVRTVTKIANGAFRDSKITSVTIPASVTEIGADIDRTKGIGSGELPFYGCAHLRKVIFEDGYGTQVSFACCKEYINEEAGTTKYYTVFAQSPLEELYIGTYIYTPANYTYTDHYSPYSDDIGAFENQTSLKKVTFSPKLRDLNSRRMFANCTKLESIELSGIDHIDPYAFTGCTALKSVNLPDVENIHAYAFSGCTALTSVDLPVAKGIDKYAFSGCTALTSANLPVAEEIGDGAFDGCSSLSEVNFPLVTNLGAYAFRGCTPITALNCSKVVSIGDGAFRGCTAIKRVDFPVLKKLGGYAFGDCTGLEEILIPEADSIGAAFYGCKALTSLVLPNVQNIIGAAFDSCTNLKNLYLGDKLTWVKNIFSGCPKGLNVYMYSVRMPIDKSETTKNSYYGDVSDTNFYIRKSSKDNYIYSFYSCPKIYYIEDEELVVQSATIDKTEITLQYGEQIKIGEGINATVVPSKNGCDRTVHWASSDESVAYVDKNNCIKTKGVGTCYIKVMSCVGEITGTAFAQCKLTVTKAPLTISAGNYTKKQGAALPTFKAVYSGFKNGDKDTVLTKQPVFTTEATAESPIGEYEVVVSGAEAQNYDISYEPGTLRIHDSSQTITWNEILEPKVRTFYTLNATASSGLPITYSYFQPGFGYGVPYIEDNKKISFSDQGKYMIVATQAGNDEYSSVSDTIEVYAMESDEGLMYIDGIYYKYTDDSHKALKVVAGYRPYSGNLVIPETASGLPVVEIDNYALGACYFLESLTIGNNVTKFGHLSIAYNHNLKSVTLPDNLVDLTDSVFFCDYKLSEVHCQTTTPYPAGTYTFYVYYVVRNFTLYVPKGSKDAYAAHEIWGVCANIVEEDLSLTPIEVKAKSYTRVYGDDNPTFEYEVKGDTLDGSPEIICEADTTSAVGEYVIVVKQGTVKNYKVTGVNGTLTITKAPLVVSAGTYAMKQGDPMPEFKATYSGFKNNETEEVLTTQPVFSTEATSDSENGTYPVIVSGAEAQNYEITYESGTITIADPHQTLTWNKNIEPKTGNTYTMDATASSGLPVAYSYLRPMSAWQIPEINGTEITFPTTGRYLIVATQSGNEAYDAVSDTLEVCALESEEGLMYIDGIYYKYADNAHTTLKVVRGYQTYKGNIVIPETANGLPVVELDNQAFYACYFLTSVTVGDNVTKFGGESLGADPNLKIVTLPYKATSLPNYLFNCDNKISEIHSRANTPYSANESIFNGSMNYETCILYVPSGTKEAYAAHELWGKFTNIVEEDVAMKVVVKAKSYTRVYGDDNPTLEYETDGATLDGTPEITCTADKTSAVGEYAIVVKQGTVKNCVISGVAGTLTITKAPLVVSAGTYAMTQGEPMPEFKATYSGFKNNETEDVITTQPVFSTEATSDSEKGTYPVTVSGAEAQNYEMTYEPGTITIAPSPHQTITWNKNIEPKTGNTYTMDASASSGLPVTYSYLKPIVGTAWQDPEINGSEITFPTEGRYLIVATQSGSEEYYAVSDTLEVCALESDEGLMYIDGIYYKYADNEHTTLKVVRGYKTYSGNVVIPETTNGLPVVEIDSKALYACYFLESVTVGDNVIKFGDQSLGADPNLKKVTLPYKATSLPNYLFNCDNNIAEIHCRAKAPYTANEFIFNGFVDFNTCILYVPRGTKDAYAAHELWGKFANIVEEDVVTDITHIENDINTGGAWHTINGAKLPGKPTVKGVYIHNGKKLVTK